MNLSEELSCGDGTAPTGPVSAWPKERHDKLMTIKIPPQIDDASRVVTRATKVRPNFAQMTTGFVRTAKQALVHGKVSEEVRNERYDTCKTCPFFIEDSKRCSECGCFMEAKTWVGGDPNTLCPKQKWGR